LAPEGLLGFECGLDGCELALDVVAIVDKFSSLAVAVALLHNLSGGLANNIWPVAASSCAQLSFLYFLASHQCLVKIEKDNKK